MCDQTNHNVDYTEAVVCLPSVELRLRRRGELGRVGLKIVRSCVRFQSISLSVSNCNPVQLNSNNYL